MQFIVIGAVELGLIYSLMSLGLFVSYRVLNVADLTVDGSFTTGAMVSAVLTVSGPPLLGRLCAIPAGAAAGLITSLLQTKLKIQPILSGILTMTFLYSANLWIGGKSNLSLLGKATVFSSAK
ncbi:MAG: ABC transporter permease, partial [Angelakisella sp.]